MKSHPVVMRVFATILVGIVGVVVSPIVKAANEDSTQVSDLLSQARLEAIRLREDANQMQNFVLNQVTWDTHAVYATQIAQDVVAMRDKVEQLDKARNMGSAWQQTAIDRIKPLMTELAATTTAVAETMITKPFDKTEYNDYLEANYDNAQHLAALISDFVDYGRTKQRLEASAKKLELKQRTN